jgi:hypothetical protein
MYPLLHLLLHHVVNAAKGTFPDSSNILFEIPIHHPPWALFLLTIQPQVFCYSNPKWMKADFLINFMLFKIYNLKMKRQEIQTGIKYLQHMYLTKDLYLGIEEEQAPQLNKK